MVKFIFNEYLSDRCFAASTTNSDLINELVPLKGVSTYKWVVGLLRYGTGDNNCYYEQHLWHYETFIGFEDVTAEECQTTINQVETYPLLWLYRNSSSCIRGKVVDYEGYCNEPLCSLTVG